MVNRPSCQHVVPPVEEDAQGEERGVLVRAGVAQHWHTKFPIKII